MHGRQNTARRFGLRFGLVIALVGALVVAAGCDGSSGDGSEGRRDTVAPGGDVSTPADVAVAPDAGSGNPDAVPDGVFDRKDGAAASDGTAPRCGNGVLDPDEACDGDCPTSCDDGVACTADRLDGSAADCTAACVHDTITACVAGDGCCPAGCDRGTDGDCSASCGDGVLDEGETCDGDCPTDCDDGQSCTADRLVGSADNCSAACVHDAITACVAGDGCCPAGCDRGTDSDCSASCGDGLLDEGETCDGDCPTDCDDGQVCTADRLVGSADNCSAACVHDAITACASGDGCCPAGCDRGTDSDCSASCGDGLLDEGETCDGDCPTDCDDGQICTADRLVGSADNCSAACVHDPITACAPGDGCCPAGCDHRSDIDCAPPAASTGFGSAQDWPVPESGAEAGDGFWTVAYSYGHAYWVTMDLTGDGLVDLVHTADPATQGVVFGDGDSPHWKVYENTGVGFATTATVWPVPDAGVTDGFWAAYWGYDRAFWATMDITGDGRPDLVHTADPTTEGLVFADDAGSYWNVYENTGSGFAPTPTRWAVPDAGVPDGFWATAWSYGGAYWVTMDLTGDRRPDLVHTADPATQGIVFGDGTSPHWNVYENTGNGFAAAPTRWAVPDGGVTDGFWAAFWNQGAAWWTTIDLTGDGLVDLVHTADPATEGVVFGDGVSPYWNVYESTGSGFAAAPTRWAVPDVDMQDGFWATAYSRSQWYWATLDLTGDGLFDLVHTADPATEGVVFGYGSAPRWQVYPGDGTGFAADPVSFSVPDAGVQDGFWATSHASSYGYWSTLDIDGDLRPDLVQTADPALDEGFVFRGDAGMFWRVYRGVSQ